MPLSTRRSAGNGRAKDVDNNEGTQYHVEMIRRLNKRLKEIETGPGSLKANNIALAKELRGDIDAHQDALEAWRTSKRYPSKPDYEDEAAALSAAANRRTRAKDDLTPVGKEDPERAVALKKHEEGMTVSQDKEAKDGVGFRKDGQCKRCHGTQFIQVAPGASGIVKCPSCNGQGAKATDEEEDAFREWARSRSLALLREHDSYPMAMAYAQREMKPQLTQPEWETFVVIMQRTYSGKPRPNRRVRTGTADKAKGEDMKRANDEVMPVGDDVPSEKRFATPPKKPAPLRSILNPKDMEAMTGRPSSLAKDTEGSEQSVSASTAKGGGSQPGPSKARDAAEKHMDSLMIATIEQRYRCGYAAVESIWLRGMEDPAVKTQTDLVKYTKAKLEGRAKDVEPVAIKTSNLVPMPAEEDDKERYAADAEPDLKAMKKEIDRLNAEAEKLGWEMIDKLTESGKETYSRGGAVPAKLIPMQKKVAALYDKAEALEKQYNAAKGKTKARDAKAVMPFQTHGSEPKDHMARAIQYEVGGDRARALDSYRAAAAGYRKANDKANEGKARDGISACQTSFDKIYQHPSTGRVKVCDSADAALRTALERTRAGESVVIIGMTVKPNTKARATDEHLGFKKLEGKLSKEKGVNDPAALAASIGRKKYGAAGMAKKSAAAKDKEVLPV